MPTRKRPAVTAPAEMTEQDNEEEVVPGLQFNETLIWRAGKPIPVADLLRRLQALAKELRDIDQEEHDRSTYTKVAEELASQNLMGHKDKGVRAWTACSLVDILRLCAPDAPFTESQLKNIFSLFVKSILPALSDPSNAYNSQHIYVLQSLSTVKSIVLLTDIPQSEELILHLFTSFFDITSGSGKSSTGEQLGKNVEHEMAAILVVLVDESTSLPAEIVEIIMAQFLRADPKVASGSSNKNKKNEAPPAADERQSTLLLKELPPAYNMAKDICNSCPEKMTRHISQYFNDVIMDASASTATDGTAKRHTHRRASNDSDDSDDLPSGPTEHDLKELHKAHSLLRELWRASPPVLQNVIPQLEAELSAENMRMRLLAVETLGDIISGIGAAGPPAPPVMDPSAYPTARLSDLPSTLIANSVLTTPLSPQPFSQAHPAAYANFLGRKKDKSAIIRAAWTTAIGRILMTSAGGIGLSVHEEEMLVKYLAAMLVDGDEKVRSSAIRAVAGFGLNDVVNKLGSIGGVNKPDSVLANLADRARDRKHGVRVEGMKTLARIWGVAAGEIAAGNETASSILGAAPSKLYDAFYANDLDIFVLLDHVSFELLLPLSFPPIKSKSPKVTNGDSQRVKDSQPNGDVDSASMDADWIRATRMLHLVKGLDAKAKKAFFAMQARQVGVAKIMSAFLKRCEEYNGGVMDENEADTKTHLTKLIEWFSKSMPEPAKVSADLWKFAKMHDRRNYQLIRFAMAPESDYRIVQKAIKELTKRVEDAPGNTAGLLETLIPLLYRVGLLVYNKSHVPAIVQYSRSDENGLAGTAHEVLKEISTHTPEVFKAHVQELCKVLGEQAPTKSKSNEPGAVDTLKACAGFAQKFPKEIPRDRKFLESLTSFAVFGTPPAAAKHAVTIIIAVAEKKEMYAKDLVQKSIKNFAFGSNHFLARLATLSQLMLLAPKEVDEESDAVVDIAINQVLLKVRTPAGPEPQNEWEDDVDDECKAKIWALKILVNRLRSNLEADNIQDIATPVYKLLDTLVQNEGELSKKRDTPASHRSHLRLTAARLFLKLCVKKSCDDLLTPTSFNRLATVAQDSHYPVRLSFLTQLKKYLGQNKLSHRFYAIVFLLAFEPADDLREDTLTWIRARTQFFTLHKNTSMETVFTRLLSLLAHHPDYSSTPEDLADFTKYILFYLNPVANADNLGLIYHMAQRVKQTRDAIDPSMSENLYYLSDLAQAVIRRYEEIHGWSMQTWPGKMSLPNALFSKMPSHQVAQDVADKLWLPDEVVDRMDELVRLKVKPKKRKSDAHDDGAPKKKSKSTAAPIAKSLPIRKNPKPKTPKIKKTKEFDPTPSSERRRSGRAAGKGKTYAEKDDDEDDKDMQMWDQPNEDDEDDGESREEDEEPEEDEAKEVEAIPKASTKKVNGHVKSKAGKKEVAQVVSEEDNDDELSDPPDSE